MRKWDVTTEKGREALERFLMERMGWKRGDFVYADIGPHWVHSETQQIVFSGWIFTGEGMLWAKRWAADQELKVETRVSWLGVVAGVGNRVFDRLGVSRQGEVDDEPTAVALALARALEETV